MRAAAIDALIRERLALANDAQALARELSRFVHARHQFARLAEPARERLARASEAALADRSDRAIAELCAATLALVPADAPEVICAEYDPDLQLELLGLDPDTLLEPLLDLGSGAEARLVRALRARGVDATALDRYLDHDGIEADFLEHPLGRGRWGTIVSHQAFSLHFIHAHLASAEMAGRYAERMLAILGALAPGGVFAYAPGLPFFEPVLERAGFAVRRQPLPNPTRHSLAPLSARVGADVAHAAHVRRP